MDEFVIMGLVLQEIEYGEADRILKILTAEKGLITAFAKNSMSVCCLRAAVLFRIRSPAGARHRGPDVYGGGSRL